MSSKNRILLIPFQVAIGVVVVLFGILIYQFVVKWFIWEILIAERITHGLWVSLLLIFSIGITYGLMVVGATEGIRYIGRKFNLEVPFKPVCSGAFLGAPAVVGLVALTNVPWGIFGNQNVIVNLIVPILALISYILSLPIRGWLLIGLPVEILYLLAIPIGAIIGYRVSKKEVLEIEHQEDGATHAV